MIMQHTVTQLYNRTEKHMQTSTLYTQGARTAQTTISPETQKLARFRGLS